MAVILSTVLMLCSAPLAILFGGTVLYKTPWNWRKVFPFLVVSVFTIAYNYTPINASDLSRYLSSIEQAGTMSFLDYLSFTNNGLLVQEFVFWLAGSLGMPHLVPGLSTAIVYGIAIYITCDYAERIDQTDAVPKILLYQLCSLPFISICNNVRNICAFAIITLAVYRDCVQKKRNLLTIGLYLLPVFMHKSGFLLLFIRLLMMVSGRFFIVTALFTLLIPTILNLLMLYQIQIMRFGVIGRLIATTIRTAYLSLTTTSDWANTVMTSRYHLMNRYMAIVVCAIFIFLILRSVSQLRDNRFVMYVLYICILTIACNVFRTPVYWRFFAVVNISCGVLILLCFRSGVKTKKKSLNIIYQLLLMGFAFILLLLQLYGSRAEADWMNLMMEVFIHPFALIAFRFVYAIITV